MDIKFPSQCVEISKDDSTKRRRRMKQRVSYHFINLTCTNDEQGSAEHNASAY